LLERDRAARPDLAAQLGRRRRRRTHAEGALHDRGMGVAVEHVDAVREGHVPGPGALLEGRGLVYAGAEQMEVMLGRRVEVVDGDRVRARVEVADTLAGRVLQRDREPGTDGPG